MFTSKAVTPVEAPGVIELLLPTRARPEQCYETLKSLESCTADKARVAVALFVDPDDSKTLEFFTPHVLRQLSIRTELFIGPPTDTQGQRYNILRQAVRPYPEYYMPMADDVVFSTYGWDAMVRDAFNRFDDKILMVYPRDSTVPETQATYTILHADWTNVLGRFSTEKFPYWYEDAWVDEVSVLIGRRKLLPFEILAPGGKGKTQGMRNLIFWERFYRNTAGDRRSEALALLELVKERNPAAYTEMSRDFEMRWQAVWKRVETVDDASVLEVEKELSGVTPGTPPGDKYLRVERRAVWDLTQKIYEHLRSGDMQMLQPFLVNLAHASSEIFRE